MADELDSGSSVGYYVWVQVPSSALYIRKGLRRTLRPFLIYRPKRAKSPSVQGLRSASVGAKNDFLKTSESFLHQVF